MAWAGSVLVLGLAVCLTACAVPDDAAYVDGVPIAYVPAYAPAVYAPTTYYTITESRGCRDCGGHHHHHRPTNGGGGGGKPHKHKKN